MSGIKPDTDLLYVYAHKLFDGIDWAPKTNQLLEIRDGTIVSVQTSTFETSEQLDAVLSEVVTPGMIDLQINGANDRQFNYEPSVETLAKMAEGARQGGSTHILPTFITAPQRDYRLALRAAADAIQAGVAGIVGVHLEGPFLSPKRAGIHQASAIRKMDAEDLETLCAPFPGKLMLTVAPEELPQGYLRKLTDAGVIVFAGHTAANAETISAAENEGLAGATHLFNAMTQTEVRAAGTVGAVLASHKLFAGIIADGHHVSAENLTIAARCMPERLCLVTDAMLTLAGTTSEFELGDYLIQLQDGRLTNAEGRLAGAHIAMNESVLRMQELSGISFGQAVQMASANPAKALGLQDRLGTIKAGMSASLTLLDHMSDVNAVLVDGEFLAIQSLSGPMTSIDPQIHDRNVEQPHH